MIITGTDRLRYLGITEDRSIYVLGSLPRYYHTLTAANRYYLSCILIRGLCDLKIEGTLLFLTWYVFTYCFKPQALFNKQHHFHRDFTNIHKKTQRTPSLGTIICKSHKVVSHVVLNPQHSAQQKTAR